MRKAKANPSLLHSRQFFFLTNQLNLREILSGAFLGNRFSYDGKYYTDLLELNPGRIPLISAPVESWMLEMVTGSQPEILVPVLLELEGFVPTREADFSWQGEENETMASYCDASSDIVPLTFLKTIHFFSEEDFRHYTARSFDDLPAYPASYFQVSPHLLIQKERNDEIISWVRSLPALPVPQTEEYKKADKICGAVSLCSNYQQETQATDWLSGLLDGSPKEVGRPETIPSWFSMGLEPVSVAEISTYSDVNEKVFAAVVSVLHHFDADTVSQKSSLLRQIEEFMILLSFSQDERDFIKKRLDKIRAFLKNLADFEPFTTTGHEVLKALYLFIIRPDYKSLSAWPLEETGATREVMLTALVFAGIIHGRKGLASEFRTAASEEAITSHLIMRMGLKQKSKPERKRTAEKGTRTKKKEVKQSVLPIPDNENPAPIDFVKIQAVKVREQLLAEDSFEQQSRLKEIALELCRIMKWENCVRTEIQINAPAQLSFNDPDKAVLLVSFTGYPRMQQVIIPDLFKKHMLTYSEEEQLNRLEAIALHP